MKNQELLEYIGLFREKAEQGKLVVFVGAGVSCNVEGMPDWNGLIQNMSNTIRNNILLENFRKMLYSGIDYIIFIF